MGINGDICKHFFQDASYRTVYTFQTVPLIFTNHSVLPNLHISLENYIVSLCGLESIYEKVNMEYLGITYEEFKKVIEEIQESNKEMIDCFKKILSNVDLAMEFREYCSKRSGIRESGEKNEIGRTQEIVNRFFRNIGNIMTEYVGIKSVKFNELKLSYDDGKTAISISHLYALFVQARAEQNAHSVPETALMDMKKENDIKENKNKEDMVKSFADKLRQRSGSGNSIEHVSRYLGRRTAQSAKKIWTVWLLISRGIIL